jgi:hypothetical protein
MLPEDTKDGISAVDGYIETQDYPLESPKNLLKFLEIVVGYMGKDGDSIEIASSVDFGATWSPWISLTLGGVGYQEQVANFFMKGKQMRFRIRSTSSFSLESFILGFNDEGVAL